MSVYSKIKLLVTGLQEELAATVGTLYGVIPNNTSADQVVTRALDTATRVNKQGLIESVVANKARIDYSLGVDRCANLLVEKAIPQIFQYTEAFGNVYWAKGSAVIVSDAATAPNGTMTADKFNELAATDTHQLYTGGEALTAGLHTFSVFAKASERTRIQLAVDITNPDPAAFFDLSNGTVISNTNCTAQIENYGNGWYRCSLTYTALTETQYPLVRNIISGTTNVYLGVVGYGTYLWGAQLETGAFATSYIPRLTNTAVTRNADVISKTGLSALIPQTKGAIFFDGYLQAGSLADSTVRSAYYITDGTNNNFFQLYRLNNTIGVFCAVSNVSQINYITTVLPIKNKRIKVIVVYNTTTADIYINGTLMATVSGILLPPLSAMYVGKENSTYWDGLIKAVAVTDELTTTDIDQLTQYNSLEEMAEEMVYTYED